MGHSVAIRPPSITKSLPVTFGRGRWPEDHEVGDLVGTGEPADRGCGLLPTYDVVGLGAAGLPDGCRDSLGAEAEVGLHWAGADGVARMSGRSSFETLGMVTQKVPEVSPRVSKDGNAAVQLVARWTDQVAAGLTNPAQGVVEVMDPEEQSDSACELVADRRHLLGPVRAGEHQTRSAV